MGSIVLFATLAAIAALLVLDARWTKGASPSVWLAVAWFALLVSRPLARWAEPGVGEVDLNPEDGSLAGAIPLAALMAASLVALFRSRFEWSRWAAQNQAVVAFLLFALLSVLWSDYSGVALKRWIRGMGTVLTVLLVLSSPDPVASIAATIRRCAIVLVPISLVLIFFFPDRGMIYERLLDGDFPVGVTTDKNSLGRFSMIVALLMVWSLTARSRLGAAWSGGVQTAVHVGLLLCSLYLVFASKSATSLACFLVGCLLLLVAATPAVRANPRRLVWGLLALGLLSLPLTLLGFLFDLPHLLTSALGRDVTLTGRVYIWRDLFAFGTNPIIGTGYASFWLGDRLTWFMAEHNVSSAHNGFLEIYLGMGITGLVLLAAIVYRAVRNAEGSLMHDAPSGRLRLMFLFVFLIYNFTEAASLLTSPMVFLLLLVAMERPRVAEASTSPASWTDRSTRNAAVVPVDLEPRER